MSHIHDQLKQPRKQLGFKRDDMFMRIGMARQQYQRLESGGNPQLDNLELVAKGLKLVLILIPQEKLQAVKVLLNDQDPQNLLDTNPWQGVFADDD